MLRAILLAFAFMVISNTAQANWGSFDVPRVDSNNGSPWRYQFHLDRGRHYVRHHRHYHHRGTARIAHSRGSGNLVSKSGARTSVSSAALPHFQCLLKKLEEAGLEILTLGGFGPRGNASAHPTGNALDINQLSRNRCSRSFPAGTTAMAKACGLVHGAIWSHPDTGHFEMANKYGYVGIGRHYAHRVRYAYRRSWHRWHGRRFAHA